MLMRIRRLAGTAVGAVFVLLLAVSMLQMGDAVNPVSFFQGSPVVIEVGDEKQRWNSLGASNGVANLFRISAEPYSNTEYGPLTTALAVKDSWSQGALTLPRRTSRTLRTELTARGASFTESTLRRSMSTVEPLANIFTALSFIPGNLSSLLPLNLKDEPKNQVIRKYNFDAININADTSTIESPTEEELQTYLLEIGSEFQRAPSWSIEALILKNTDIADAITVTNDQTQQFYNENISLFTIPEAWNLVDLVFSTSLEANLFQAQLDQGTDIETAISTIQGQIIETELSTRENFSSDVLDRLATLSKGDITQPITQENGDTLYQYLRAYQPGETPSYEAVREDVETELRLSLAQEQLKETAEAIQTRAQDIDFADAVIEAGYSLETFDGLQIVETAPEAIAFPILFNRLRSIQTPRETPSVLTLENKQRELLFRVTNYESARPLTLEEARPELIESWIEKQALIAARELAESIAEDIRTGENIEVIFSNLNTQRAEKFQFLDLSRLKINSTAPEGNGDFIKLIDDAILNLGSAIALNEEQQTLFDLNPNLASPFSLADAEVQIIDRGRGYTILTADLIESEEDSEGEESEQPRVSLIESLEDSRTSTFFSAAILVTYLNDVAADRTANIDETVIENQILAGQQNAAQHGG